MTNRHVSLCECVHTNTGVTHAQDRAGTSARSGQSLMSSLAGVARHSCCKGLGAHICRCIRLKVTAKLLHPPRFHHYQAACCSAHKPPVGSSLTQTACLALRLEEGQDVTCAMETKQVSSGLKSCDADILFQRLKAQ